MKKLISILVAGIGLTAFGQYKPNYYDTNSNPAISPAGLAVVTNVANGVGANATNHANMLSQNGTNYVNSITNQFLHAVPTLEQVTSTGNDSTAGINIGGNSRFTNHVAALSNLTVGSQSGLFGSTVAGGVAATKVVTPETNNIKDWVFFLKDAGYANANGYYSFQLIDVNGTIYYSNYNNSGLVILSNGLTHDWQVNDASTIYSTAAGIDDPTTGTMNSALPAYDPAPVGGLSFIRVQPGFFAGTNSWVGNDKSFLRFLWSDTMTVNTLNFNNIFGTYYNSTFGGFAANSYLNNAIADPTAFTADLSGIAILRAFDWQADLSAINDTVSGSIACFDFDGTGTSGSSTFTFLKDGVNAIDYGSIAVCLVKGGTVARAFGATNGSAVFGSIPAGFNQQFDNEFAFLSHNGKMFSVNSNGLANAAGGYSYSNTHFSTNQNFAIFTNKTIYCVNGTNQIIELIRAADNPWVIYRFVSTNGNGNFILTNSSLDNVTLRNGIDHTLKQIGVGEVGLFSDGSSWQLASKFKTVWPNAQFSCTTNIALGTTPRAISFNTTDFNNSQGIALLVGTNSTWGHTSIWITNSGQYEFSPSVIEAYDGNHTITFWFTQNLVTIANSATACKGANNTTKVVTVPFTVNVTVPTQFEIWAVSDDATGELFQFQAANTPVAGVPLSPSVICPVKRISDSRP